MPTIIGDAYVDIKARDGGFEREVRRMAKTIKDISIPVGADTTQFSRDINRALNSIKPVDITVGADTSSAEKHMESFYNNVEDVEVNVFAETGPFSDTMNTIFDDYKSVVVHVDADASLFDSLMDDLLDQDLKLDISVGARATTYHDDMIDIVDGTDEFDMRVGAVDESFFSDLIRIVQNTDQFDMRIGAVDAGFSAAIQEMVDSVGDVDVDISADVSNYRRAINEIRNEEISVPVDVITNARESLNRIQEALSSEGDAYIRVGLNTDSAEFEFEEFKKYLETREVRLRATISEEGSDAFVESIQDSGVDVTVSVSPDYESIANTIHLIQESLDDNDFDVSVNVNRSSTDTIRNDLESSLNETATITAVANTLGAEAQLNFASRDRMTRLLLDYDRRYGDRTLNRLYNYLYTKTNGMFRGDRNPILQMFTGPDVSRAMRNFTISMAGVINPSDVRDQILNIMTNFDSMAISASTAATAIGGISQSLITAGGFAINLATDASKAVGIIAAAPAALSFGFASLKTWGWAWQGITEAMAYDTESAMKAISKMPPYMQEAAEYLHFFSVGLQDAVSQAYWTKMEDQVKSLIETISEDLYDGFYDMSDAMADVSIGVVRIIENFTTSGGLTATFRNFTEAIKEGEGFVTNFVDVFLKMTEAGSIYLPQFTGWLSTLAEDFNEFMTASIDSGAFDTWIREAVESIQDLSSIVWDSLGIFKELGDAAHYAGIGGLQDLADGFRAVHEWIKNPAVFFRITDIFRDSAAGFDAIASGFGDLASTLWDHSDQISNTFVTASETIGIFLEHISNALDNTTFFDSFDILVRGVNEGVAQMGPGIEDFTHILSGLMEMFGETAIFLGEGFTILMGLLRDVFDPIKEGFMSIHGPMNEAFQLLTSIIKGPLVLMAETIGVLMKSISVIPVPLLALATGFLTLIGPSNTFRMIWGKISGTKFTPPRLDAFRNGLASLNTSIDRTKGKLDGLFSSGRGRDAVGTIPMFDPSRNGIRKFNESVDASKTKVDNFARSTSITSAPPLFDIGKNGVVATGTEVDKTRGKVSALFNNSKTKIMDVASSGIGPVQTAVGKLSTSLRNIASGALGAIFNPAMLGMAALTAAITVWQNIQNDIKVAKDLTDNLSKAFDPVSGKFKDTSEAASELKNSLKGTKGDYLFQDIATSLEKMGVDVDKFSENLVKMDRVSLDKLRGEVDAVRDQFASDWGFNRVSNAVNSMSDEMVAATGKTREELMKLNAFELNRLLDSMDRATDNIGGAQEAAVRLRDALSEITTEVGGELWDYAESGAASQGVIDALSRANDQAVILDNNFKTIHSTTSSVAEKLTAMQSNMDMLSLDTSAWNDPMERMWATTKKNTDEFAKLKDALGDLDPSQLITIESSLNGAQHAALNFSDGFGEASSQLNSVMKETSGAIKESFIESFDRARESGESMSQATKTALDSVKGSSDSLRESLANMGIPEEQINALFDTFGILEEDLEKSIVVDEASKQQAKRDIIEVELAAQAFASGNYEAYLKFLTTDADDAMAQWLKGARSQEEIKQRLSLDDHEARQLLENLAVSEWPVQAIMNMDTLETDQKLAQLTARKVEIEGMVNVPGISPESKQALNDELDATKAAIDGLKGTPQVDVQIDEAKAKAEQFLADVASRSVDIKANADSIPSDVMTKVQEALVLSDSSAQIKFREEMSSVGINVPELTGSAAKEAESRALITFKGSTEGLTEKITAGSTEAVNSANATIPPVKADADTSALSTKIPADATTAVANTNSTLPGIIPQLDTTPLFDSMNTAMNTISGTTAQMTVDGDNQPVMGAVSEAAGAAGQGANFPINFDLGQLEHMRGVLRYYQNTTINVDAAVQMGGVEHLIGVLNANQSRSINVSAVANAGPVERLAGVIRSIPTRTVPVNADVSSALSRVSTLTRQINAVPNKQFSLTTNIGQALTDIQSVRSRIEATPDKQFTLHTDIGQALTDIQSVRSRIEAVPDKEFTIRTDIGQVLTDIRTVVSRINAIPDKTFNISANTTSADNAINRLNNRTVSNKSHTITTYTRSVALAANGGMFSGGIQTFANGGMSKAWKSIQMNSFAKGSENHVAQIAKGGWPYRVWAEPETGGEAYIPLAQSKRSRSTDILEQVAKHFGYSLVKNFASGGILKSATKKSPGIQTFARGGLTAAQRIAMARDRYYGALSKDEGTAWETYAMRIEKMKAQYEMRALNERLRAEERARNERLRKEERERHQAQRKQDRERMQKQHEERRVAERARHEEQRKKERDRYEELRKQERERIQNQYKDQREREKAQRAANKVVQDRIKAEQKAARDKERAEQAAAREADRVARERKRQLERAAKSGNQDAQKKLDEINQKEKSFADAVTGAFKSFSSALDQKFGLTKELSPVQSTVQEMDSILRQAIRENGSVNPLLAQSAADVRKTLGPQDNMSSMWSKGVNYGLRELNKNILADGTMLKSFTLRDLEAGFDRTSTRIEDAKRNLDGLYSAWEEVANSVYKVARDPFSLQNTLTLAEETNKPISVEMLNKSAKAVIDRNIKFRGNLEKMREAGFPPALIREVAELGAGQGILVAEELLRSASPTQIAELNKNYDLLNTTALDLGGAVADSFYGAGISAGEGVYHGLIAQRDKIEEAATILSNSLIGAFERALQIKSPSRVMRDRIGVQVPAGIAVGMVKGISKIDTARGLMYNSITKPPTLSSIQSKRDVLDLTARGNNSAPTVQYNIVNNNPIAETPSQTLRKNNRELGLIGLN